jgi:hypothetical protein
MLNGALQRSYTDPARHDESSDPHRSARDDSLALDAKAESCRPFDHNAGRRNHSDVRRYPYAHLQLCGSRREGNKSRRGHRGISTMKHKRS